MSHRPRFRVWDKQRSQFMEDNVLVLRLSGDFALAYNTKQGLYPIPDTGQKDLGLDRFVIEQDTGLFTPDGASIFEGDIVEFSTNGHAHGPEREDGWRGEVWYCEEDACFMLSRNNSHSWDFSMADDIDRKSLKVIGNVHENPELLPK